MITQTFTIDQLCVSPLNVRTNVRDATSVDALAANIRARGLLFPLIVHPSSAVPADLWPKVDGVGQVGDAHGAPWAALAGGRRYRAIRQLVDAGHLPPDWPIAAVVRDLSLAEITELSLAENMLRRELNPYEVHAAIARAVAQGATTAEIAENIGQEVAWVRRQLRLGNLDRDVFDAYARGELSAEQAQAYAATEDQALQRAAFAHFRGDIYARHNPAAIRGLLKVGDRELERLLAFVGAPAYRAAGGRFELDLFADGPEDRGRVVDEGLLRHLVENRFSFLRASYRVRTGCSDLRFQDSPPRNDYGVDQALAIGVPDLGGDAEIGLPSGDVVCVLRLEEGGLVEATFWWASRKAKRAAEKAGAADARGLQDPNAYMAETHPATPAGAIAANHQLPRGHPQRIHDDSGFDSVNNHAAFQAARAAVKDDYGLTGDGLHVLRSARREILRALLVADADCGPANPGAAEGPGTLGRDYIIWAQLRDRLGDDNWRRTGALGLAAGWHGSDDAEPKDVVQPHLDQMEAHAVWSRALTDIATQDFITLADPAAAFTRFAEASPATQALAGAVLAGLALIRSANVPGWRVAVHDRLAHLAGGDDATLRRLWRPTPDFVALFPKMKRLELAQPFVEAGAFRTWHKLADGELTRTTARALTGDGSARRQQAAARWVHPLLSFNSAHQPAETMKEAVE